MMSATPATITVCLPAARPRPVRQHVAPRPGVLVVLSADGFCEVYATPGVRVHVAERLAAHPADEVTAEQYLESQLPAWARELHIPRGLAAARMPRCRTAGQEIERRMELSLARECLRKDARHG
jgi:hypothetical protein